LGENPEPVDADAFSAKGSPTEIGEQGDPDRYEHIDVPAIKRK
jgi:hypothetical protein